MAAKKKAATKKKAASGKKDTETLTQHLTMIYALYALSSILQFHQITLLPGLLALVVAYVLNASKKQREVAKGTFLESHLRWGIRTFWIDTAVLLPVSVFISTMLILKFTNITNILHIVEEGDSANLMSAIHIYMSHNLNTILMLSLVTMVPLVTWWMRRCWVGYKLLKAKKPIKNVTSWI